MVNNEYKSILLKRLSEKNPLLQILLGPRQIGKTTVAQGIYDSWDGPKIMVTADSPSPPQPEWIAFHWQKARNLGAGTLLILDEVQKVPQWSEQVKILFDQDRNKLDLRVLLLGSSSLYLQKGLTESLAGRFESLYAPHWTYRDYKTVFGWDFEKYIRFGAYPGSVSFVDEPLRWADYIRRGIIEPVIDKDILSLNPVHKPALFKQTFELAALMPARMISYQKLLGQLQDRGNAATIKNYLDLLEKSFLIKVLGKYSGSQLLQRSSSPKIIVLNQALIHAYQEPDRMDRDPAWYGFVFESLVGAHLSLLPRCRLYYWNDGKNEVDYVVQTPELLYAIEIKSGFKKRSGKGLVEFSKKFPKAHCFTWQHEDAVRFMETLELA